MKMFIVFLLGISMLSWTGEAASLPPDSQPSIGIPLPGGGQIQLPIGQGREQIFPSRRGRKFNFKGEVVSLSGNQMTVETRSGRLVTVHLTERTRIEGEENLDEGAQVEVKAVWRQGILVARKVEVEEEEDDD